MLRSFSSSFLSCHVPFLALLMETLCGFNCTGSSNLCASANGTFWMYLINTWESTTNWAEHWSDWSLFIQRFPLKFYNQTSNLWLEKRILRTEFSICKDAENAHRLTTPDTIFNDGTVSTVDSRRARVLQLRPSQRPKDGNHQANNLQVHVHFWARLCVTVI